MWVSLPFKLKIEESDEYTTLAGFVLDQLEDIPQKGDYFDYKQYRVEVTQVSNTKIEEVFIKEQRS